jgi:drug/metabolite transporter superfamily protein YnfA
MIIGACRLSPRHLSVRIGRRTLTHPLGGAFCGRLARVRIVSEGFRPDRFDIIGAVICLVGVAVIMYEARGVTGPLRR